MDGLGVGVFGKLQIQLYFYYFIIYDVYYIIYIVCAINIFTYKISSKKTTCVIVRQNVKIIYNFSGKIHDQERRVGFRGHSLGDSEPRQARTLRAPIQRGGGAKSATAASRRRLQTQRGEFRGELQRGQPWLRLSAATHRLVQGHLRSDARVLATGGERETDLPRDIALSATEKSWIRSNILILSHKLRRARRP